MFYSQALLKLINELNFNFSYFILNPNDYSAAEDVVRSVIKTESFVIYTPAGEKDLHKFEQFETLANELSELLNKVNTLIENKDNYPTLSAAVANISYEINKYNKSIN
jgi:hypothetical protein